MALQIRLAARRGTLDEIVAAVANNRRRFPNVREVVRCRALGSTKSYAIVTYRNGYAPSASGMAGIISAYMDLDCVAEAVVIGAPVEFGDTTLSNALHFFLDIDSVLAKGSPVILKNVGRVLRRMVQDGHRIYLVSSRSADQVRADIKALGVMPYGVAENGGIIVFPSLADRIKLGDRSEPDEVLHYMKINCRRVIEDVSQPMQITERIFRKDVPEAKFREYVERSKADVDVLSSKTSYHVAKRGVDKGSALERLKARLDFNEYNVAVGVGDSDLDVAMFEKSDWSFAVNSPSRRAKKAATMILKGSYGDGIAEICDRWL